MSEVTERSVTTQRCWRVDPAAKSAWLGRSRTALALLDQRNTAWRPLLRSYVATGCVRRDERTGAWLERDERDAVTVENGGRARRSCDRPRADRAPSGVVDADAERVMVALADARRNGMRAAAEHRQMRTDHFDAVKRVKAAEEARGLAIAERDEAYKQRDAAVHLGNVLAFEREMARPAEAEAQLGGRAASREIAELQVELADPRRVRDGQGVARCGALRPTALRQAGWRGSSDLARRMRNDARQGNR